MTEQQRPVVCSLEGSRSHTTGLGPRTSAASSISGWGPSLRLEREKVMTEDFRAINEALQVRIEELIEQIKTLRVQRDIARLERDVLRNKVQEETA